MKAMKAMDGEDEAALRASGSVACRFPFPSVAISLSGGVDSMVLATVLKRLSEEKSESKASPLFSVVATHVDYANRPESAAESAFVSDWCARRGVACVARRAGANLRRGATPREEYEAKSRAIRYDLYKEQMAIHGFPAVFVGHHEGDVQENVIANVMRGASALDLNGMRPEGVVEGVAIWRPMLGLPKEAIYDFAHAFGTPYFLDTTPRWSTRGKLRNQLVPLLSDVFGAGVMGNLKKLGDDAEELREMVESKVFAPFRRAIRSSDAGAYADLGAFEAEGRFFWREALRGFCHGIGVGAMTDKSVDQLRARVFPRAKRDGWITLKKGARSFVRGQTFAMFSLQFFGDEENNATEEREEASDESRRRAARRAEKRRGGGGGGGGGAGRGEGGGVSRNKTPLFRNPDGSPVEVRPGGAGGVGRDGGSGAVARPDARGSEPPSRRRKRVGRRRFVRFVVVSSGDLGAPRRLRRAPQRGSVLFAVVSARRRRRRIGAAFRGGRRGVSDAGASRGGRRGGAADADRRPGGGGRGRGGVQGQGVGGGRAGRGDVRGGGAEVREVQSAQRAGGG